MGHKLSEVKKTLTFQLPVARFWSLKKPSFLKTHSASRLFFIFSVLPQSKQYNNLPAAHETHPPLRA